MDSRGQYARPELLSLSIDRTSTTHLPERVANPAIEAVRDTEILHPGRATSAEKRESDLFYRSP